MELKNTLNNLIEKSQQSIKTNENDYIGENGLLYCGICHTQKQIELNVFGTIRRPMCVCKCEAERMKQREKEEKKAELERKIKRLRQMGFPESEMAEWSFDNDDMANPKITNAMKNYVKNFKDLRSQGKGLLLYGNCGSGKTFAACEVANALIDKGYPVLATNFARLTNTIQGMYEGKQRYIDSLNQFDLLIIDDLGAERSSEFMQEMIYNIIDNRYRAGLPMIITTNLSIDKIKNPPSIEYTRIYDRILERCFPIEISGASRRRKAVRDSYSDMKELLGV